jgi:hypothetical protein
LRHHVPRWAPEIAAVFLFLQPAVYHVTLTAYRESLTLSCMLLLSAVLLSLCRRPSWLKAAGAGMLLGAILLTCITLIFVPLLLAPLLFFWNIPKRHLALMFFIPIVALSLWGLRNRIQTGEFRLIGTWRVASNLRRRAEQAETFRLRDPALCLWVEYVTRNRSQASPFCPERPELMSNDVAVQQRSIPESKATILRHLPNHVWNSMFYAVELHLPFVNGWGLLYNLLEVAATALLYLGCLLSLPFVKKRIWGLCVAFILAITIACAPIQALPRYHMYVFHSYVVLAGIGYALAFQWFRKDNITTS